MPPFTGRKRERISVSPPGNRVYLGKIQEIWVSGQWIGQQYSSEERWSPPEIASEYERTWDEVHPGPPYLRGGPFTSVKARLPHFDVKGTGKYESNDSENNRKIVYTGGFGVPVFPADSLLIDDYINIGNNWSNASLFPSLDALGSQAYTKLRPQLASAGLGVALAEARDIPRMLKTTSLAFHDSWKAMGGSTISGSADYRMRPKKVADNFLNVQFGWIPFLSDMGKFINLYHKSGDYMRQLRRDNNTWVKRKRVNQIVESITVVPNLGINYRVQPTANFQISRLFSSAPTAEIFIKDSTLVWFEGVFKYYRPEFSGAQDWFNGNTPVGDLNRLLTVYGARINPSVIYKATPWTWLGDWFTNIGDTVDRASDWAFDGMVSKYMYLMHHKVRELILRQKIPLKTGGTLTLEWSRSCDIKRRVGADNNFGFSLSGGGLTGRQIAILGALGISRM